MKERLNEKDMLERELKRIKSELFRASTVRELKFLQEKIRYLNGMLERLRDKG